MYYRRPTYKCEDAINANVNVFPNSQLLKFGNVLTIRQAAKLNSLPNFPTIRYYLITVVLVHVYQNSKQRLWYTS